MEFEKLPAYITWWVGGLATLCVLRCLFTRFHCCLPWPKCSADSTRFSLWSVLEPSAICTFVSITARLIAGNEPLEEYSKFILSDNVLLNSWINLFVYALFFLVFVLTCFVCRLNPSKLILKDVCGNTCQVPGLSAETPTLSTFLGTTKLQNFIREHEQRTVFDLVEDTFVARF